MPAVELKDRNQKAVLWAASGFDDYGQPKRASASVELSVRWEWRKSKALDRQGNEIMTDATIIVDREIACGSVLWKGSLDELAAAEPGTGTGTDLAPGADVTTYYEVVAYDETPDLKGRNFRRQVRVKRLSDSLPESAAIA